MDIDIKELEQDNNPTDWENKVSSNLPISVFKYRSDFYRDLLMIKNNQIYIPNRGKLNDPNESCLDFSELNREFKTWKLKHPHDKKIDDVKNFLKKEIYDVGIFSLCKNNRTECLWSYYANGHCGFCIEYDLNELKRSLNAKVRNILEVKYKYKRYNVNIENLTEILKHKLAYIRYIQFTKSYEWKQEKEVRIVTESSGFYNISDNCVKAIYLGTKCSDNNKKLVLNTLKNTNIKFYKMKFKPNNFGMYSKLLYNK